VAGTTITHFIPKVWSAELETQLHSFGVIAPTWGKNYEGEIAKGNAVKITGAVDPTISDYASTRSITSEDLNDDGQELAIDQEKAFAFNVDDIDKAQAAGDLGAYTTAAAEKLSETAESYLAGLLLSQSYGLNITGSSPVTVDTYAKAKTAVLAIRKRLAQQKVPESGRFLIVNPDFTNYVLDGLSDASVAGGDVELRNGQIGRGKMFGFTVLESPLLGTAGTPAAVGYHESGVAYADQINELETLRHPTKFADIVRGLHVYGAKVTRQVKIASYVSGGVAQNPLNQFLS
jgi:hypothetical protein